MDECLFCRLVAGEIPATRVAETERALAFMDIFPAVPGHVLVIPRAHADDALAADDADLAACVALAARVARAQEAALGAEGVNLLSSSRAAAGQTVFHLHVHVLPRVAGDGFAVPWPVAPGDPEAIAALAARLRAALGA